MTESDSFFSKLSKQIVSFVVKEKNNTFYYARTQFEKQCDSAMKKKIFNSTENAYGLKEGNVKLWTGGVIAPNEKYRKNDEIERTKTKNDGN